MKSEAYINNVVLTMEYEQGGRRYKGRIPAKYVALSTESINTDDLLNSSKIYSDGHTYELTFESREPWIFKERVVKSITHTAEIDADGSTVADFEQARRACGAPKDARIEIDRRFTQEEIRLGPVRVRFIWEE